MSQDDTGTAGAPESDRDSQSQKIGKVEHPVHGTYYLYHCKATGLYGLSRVIHPIHCGYPTLAAAMAAKGL